MAKVCHALAYARSNERVGQARPLSCSADVSETIAIALPCQSWADVSKW